MADEDGQEKTEDATPRKLEQAYEKGQTPRSRDLVAVSMLIIGGIGMLLYVEQIYRAFVTAFEMGFTFDREKIFDDSAMMRALLQAAYAAGKSLLPLFATLAVVAIAASVASGGLHVSSHPLMFKFEKLNPLSGIKRMFSLQSLVELIKSIMKVSLVGFTAWLVVKAQFAEYLGLIDEPIQQAMLHSISMVAWAFVWLSLSLALVAAIDVPYQNWQFRKQLRMTKQEVKDEYKDSEGKPEIKAKQRQRAREMAFAGMMAEVPKADVVITNPTHFAVALRYDPTKGGAPKLVAKGADLIAEQIKRVAIANNVVILAAPPLARSIFYHTKLFKEIPSGLYVAVAQVLAYVYHLKRYQKGQGPNPGAMPDVDVPNNLRR
ncbi:Flagellar biosynthetic protein [gamma proteobacterium HdN1]|nr:Flagellar biosynthetic protein [gamma proteobacterium HdN1]